MDDSEIVERLFPLSEEELWWRSLEMRTERLAKLAKLKAPKAILATETMLVLKAAGGIAPKELGEALGTFLQTQARISMSRCTGCGGALPKILDDWCPDCMAEAEREADADDHGTT